MLFILRGIPLKLQITSDFFLKTMAAFQALDGHMASLQKRMIPKTMQRIERTGWIKAAISL